MEWPLVCTSLASIADKLLRALKIKIISNQKKGKKKEEKRDYRDNLVAKDSHWGDTITLGYRVRSRANLGSTHSFTWAAH